MKDIEAFKFEIEQAVNLAKAVGNHERAQSLEATAAIAVQAMQNQLEESK